MENFLRADIGKAAFTASPSMSYLADEVASTCPLITPSPPTNALVNPLPETPEPDYNISEELANKLHQVKESGDCASTSSSNSAEPVCTQLLNHRNSYHHVIKDEEKSAQETNGKVQPVQLTFRNPPDNFCFMSWNWPLIRKISAWLFLSGLVAMVALVIAMIAALPKKCNPPTEWYQGGAIYEIFPASFSDSNGDMIGDFIGITQRLDYLESLGIRAVRLNSIFSTPNYPEDYKNFSTFKTIAKPLGTLEEFTLMSKNLHVRNISIVLDLHLEPVLRDNPQDPFNVVDEAIDYWLDYGVDGFYIKDLHLYVEREDLVQSLRNWKRLVGPDRAIIVNSKTLDAIPKKYLYVLLNNVDLIDIQLQIEAGAESVTHQIESALNGTLFSKSGMPWIQWSLSDEDSVRLTNRLPMGNATLGATLLQLMLPGTPSIFYGDEIGLQQVYDPEGEREDLRHLHQFVVMEWEDRKFSKSNVLPWMHGETTKKNFEQKKIVAKMINLRNESPAVYINSVVKDGDSRASAQVKYAQKDLLVIQRWYPRRKSYVVVSNLGTTLISSDLSKLLYSGQVVVGPRPDSVSESILFDDVSLWPGESVVIALD